MDGAAPTCLVCCEGGPELLTGICRCKTTHIHKACLKRWVETSRAARCATCDSAYTNVRLTMHPRRRLTPKAWSAAFMACGLFVAFAIPVWLMCIFPEELSVKIFFPIAMVVMPCVLVAGLYTYGCGNYVETRPGHVRVHVADAPKNQPVGGDATSIELRV